MILETAKSLGLELPTYTREERPDLFQCWEDRVILFSRLFEAGRDTIALRRETNLYAGHHLPSSSNDPFGLEVPDELPEVPFVETAESQALLASIEATIKGQG